MRKTFLSKSINETLRLGHKIGKLIEPPLFIALIGPLGAGKTLITKGLAKGLGINPDEVNSPTFTIMNIYDAKFPVYHYDLYRMETEQDLEALGLTEFFDSPEAVVLAEWAEKGESFYPSDYLTIRLEYGDKPTERDVDITASGKLSKSILGKIK